MPDHFLIFGHRGSPRRFPENTLASFQEAIDAGADGFETDLRLLSDGVPILYHDDEAGEDVVETLSSADFARRGMVLQRVSDLASFAGRATMILEVKRSKWEDVLVSTVGSWPDIVVASFDHFAIAELARRSVAFPLGLTIAGTMIDLHSYAHRLGATWCFPDFHYIDAGLVSSLQGAGIRVVPWTPDRPSEWDRLRAIGCDGMITNLPREAVQWRAGAR